MVGLRSQLLLNPFNVITAGNLKASKPQWLSILFMSTLECLAKVLFYFNVLPRDQIFKLTNDEINPSNR